MLKLHSGHDRASGSIYKIKLLIFFLNVEVRNEVFIKCRKCLFTIQSKPLRPSPSGNGKTDGLTDVTVYPMCSFTV